MAGPRAQSWGYADQPGADGGRGEFSGCQFRVALKDFGSALLEVLDTLKAERSLPHPPYVVGTTLGKADTSNGSEVSRVGGGCGAKLPGRPGR